MRKTPAEWKNNIILLRLRCNVLFIYRDAQMVIDRRCVEMARLLIIPQLSHSTVTQIMLRWTALLKHLLNRDSHVR